MSSRSPLRNAQPDAVSVCGKILRNGQSITVPESAVGPRERAMESKGKVKIRTSNEKGKLQIVCTLGQEA